MSQLNCGTLKATTEQGISFRGDIALGSIVGAVALSPVTRKSDNPDAPDYDVTFRPKGGEVAVAGSAWLKNTSKVGDFLTLTLDNPFWPREVYVTAFPVEGKRGEFRIVWSRPRRQQQEAA